MNSPRSREYDIFGGLKNGIRRDNGFIKIKKTEASICIMKHQ